MYCIYWKEKMEGKLTVQWDIGISFLFFLFLWYVDLSCYTVDITLYLSFCFRGRFNFLYASSPLSLGDCMSQEERKTHVYHLGSYPCG